MFTIRGSIDIYEGKGIYLEGVLRIFYPVGIYFATSVLNRSNGERRPIPQRILLYIQVNSGRVEMRQWGGELYFYPSMRGHNKWCRVCNVESLSRHDGINYLTSSCPAQTFFELFLPLSPFFHLRLHTFRIRILGEYLEGVCSKTLNTESVCDIGSHLYCQSILIDEGCVL